MAKNSFKAKNSLNLEPKTRPASPDIGDMYYDATSNTVAKYNGYWSSTDTKVDITVQADFTSSTLTATISENSTITISGTIGAAFNLHGLARNANGKQITIFNNTNQKMVVKHASVTETTASARITTPNTRDLKIPKKTSCVVFYEDSTQKWIANQSGGGGGGTSFEAVQTAHGFPVLTPIYHNGTIWVAAIANSASTLGMYVTTEVATDSFIATKFGAVEMLAHGLTVGEYYYVSRTVAGAITSTEPLFGYSNPVLYVTDVDNIHVMCYRPALIGDGTVSDSEIGAILAFPFVTEPAGFLYCDGRTVSRTTYNELYSAIGTSHGIGDGSTTFNLPDYRGRFLRGVDGTAGNDPDKLTRTATNGGNSGNSAGSVQGDVFGIHTHTQDAHNHTQNSHNHTQDAHNHTIVGEASDGASGSTPPRFGGANTASTTRSTTATNQAATATNQAATATNQNTGSNETRPKNIAVGYFIRFAARGAIAGDKVPAGTVNAFAGAAASVPSGYMVCNGASLLRADYPTLFSVIGISWGTVDGTHFNLPDLRGGFLRGVDGGIARDPDRATRTAIATGGNTGDNVGSYQTDIFESHTHGGVIVMSGTTFTGPNDRGGSGSTSATGGNETRPKNMNVNFIIKY